MREIKPGGLESEAELYYDVHIVPLGPPKRFLVLQVIPPEGLLQSLGGIRF